MPELSPESKQRCNLLIIDDSIDDYDLCKRLLIDRKSTTDNNWQFHLRHALSGEDGFSAIAKELPDCVLLDYSLPGNDGLSVLEKIRQDYSNLPIIMMTGQGSEKLAVKLLKAGAQDYIVKSDIHSQNLSHIIVKTLQIIHQQKVSDNNEATLSILIVDDNEDDRELISRALNKSSTKKYRYFEAESSKEALKKINRWSPDFILLDYSMPGENGIELLKKINEEHPFIPAVIFSGQGNESIATEAIKNGAFHYLVKSDITSDTLDNIIRQGLEKKSLERIVDKKNQEIKHYQQEHQALHGAMEYAVEGVSQIDPKGCYTYLNTAYASACGYEPNELIGNNWEITVHKEDQEGMIEAYQYMLDTGKVVREIRGIRKDQSIFHKRVTMISHYDESGQFIGHYCFMSDISERKQAEEAILRSNMELERFAYVASHDLQEPLRMVNSFTELLSKKYEDQLDNKAQQYIDYICNGAQRMQALVKDLLEYARLSKTVDNYEDIDLNSLKPIILESLHSSIEQANASIEWQDLPTVHANIIRLSSVFQNLISNGLKYRRSDCKPHITVSAEAEGDHWVFAISDNGIGMKQEYCEKIFQPFQRLHKKEEYPGTGIGLSICQKIIEELGGKIWAKSALGEGSTFYFSLPKIKI